MERTRNRSLFKYLFALTLSGTNGIVAAQIALPSNQIALVRAAIGCITLVALLLIKMRGTKNLTCRTYPKEIPYLLISGAGMGTNWVLMFRAYQLVGVGITTLIYYLGPIVVMALSPLLFGTKLSAKKLPGFAVVAAGAVLIALQSMSSQLSEVGLFLAALTTVTYTLTVVFTKKVQHIHGLENAAIQLCGSFGAVLFFSAIMGEKIIPIPAQSLVWALVIGFVNTAFELYFYFTAMDQLPVQKVAVFGYAEPLSAVVFATLLLGEPFGAMRILGAACIIGGAIWCELSRDNQPAAVKAQVDTTTHTVFNANTLVSTPESLPQAGRVRELS
ncbi:MAG: DMT family transporter [Atopobiaceae bacterium]